MPLTKVNSIQQLCFDEVEITVNNKVRDFELNNWQLIMLINMIEYEVLATSFREESIIKSMTQVNGLWFCCDKPKIN